MSLRRYTWRAMQQRPGRTVLTMLSIVIGVTAAVAVGLGTATTRNAYKQMFAMVTGRATLEVDGKGGKSFPDDVVAKVAEVAGVEAVTPLVERPTSMTLDEERRLRIQILGIDPARDSQVRDYKIASGRQVQLGADEIVLEAEFAKNMELKIGDEVKLLTNYRSKPFEIVGLFNASSGAAFTQLSMAFLPIDRAQYYFNGRYVPKNAIDKVQVVTKADADPDKVEPLVAAVLPETVQVHRPAASTQLMRETLLSSEQGLQLTTLFSLLMAAFIILNTFLMNVSERRRHLSIMRAVGAVKGQITWMLIGESLLLGVIGTIIGIGMGVALAFVGTYLIGRAFDVQLPRLVEVMTPWPFIQGALFGLCMSLVGAIVPALLAGRISPLEGMNRVVGGKGWDFTRPLLASGSLLTIGSLILIFGCIFGYFPIELATYGGVLLLIGLVLLDCVILAPQAAFVAGLLKPFARVEVGLALKQVLRNHMRSALTVGVLFIAGSTGVGMANSILDCVKDVHDWYEQAITGDYFVRAMMPDMATGTAADLPEGLGEELAQVPHLRAGDGLEAASFVEARVPLQGKTDDALNAIVVAREYPPSEFDPSFDLISGDITRIRDQLHGGSVIVGSVLAGKLGLKLGDKLPLETTEGVQEFPIAGVANEYMVGGMAVHMAREHAQKWLGVEGVDGYIIKAEKGHQEELKPILAAIAAKYDVLLMSHGEIRANVERFISGTEWSLWLLVFMGFVVAAFGIVNTLTMNVLEQTRELGLLRIVAMTKKQVRRTIVTQALIIGGVGLPPGLLLGVGIAYVLNLAMMPSFGHPITFHLHTSMLLWTLGGAIVIVLIAAIIPARRAASINVVEALHYE